MMLVKLTAFFRIPSKCLSFAGTKDRRAITRQFIVARFLNPAKIAGINKTCNAAGTKNLKVSNIVKTDRMLKLGDLKGNRFTLLLRDVKGATDEGIETAMQLLKQNGFINYFGLQRFGTSSLGSHQIGALLLRQDWQSTIDAILGEREGETDQAAIKARQIWRETKSAKAAHDAFPPRHQAERQILWHFHKQNGSTDLVGAILSISRELRLMYVHGFQSAVWNRLVSRRIAEFGRAPVVGDIVLVDEKPVILTEDNLCSFSMSDVVLPMPGYDMIYPKGVLSAVVKEVIEGEFKISTESCCFQPKTKTLWDLPGAYRRAVVMPEALTWAIGYLESVDAPSESFHSESDHMKCIQVSLGLPTSAYATMALREVMELVSSK